MTNQDYFFNIGAQLATGIYNPKPADLTQSANEREESPRVRYNTIEDKEDAELLTAFKRAVRR